jgi:hypothetical protein
MKSTTLSQYENFEITASGPDQKMLNHATGWRIIQSFKRGHDWFLLWGQLTDKALKAEKKRNTPR